MRATQLAAFLVILWPSASLAVTIVNRDTTTHRVLVCDQNCGPRFGEDWGSAFDFTLAPGESRSFSCSGKCYVGTYDSQGRSPTLGDMADAEMDGELFSGNDTGRIVNGYARPDR